MSSVAIFNTTTTTNLDEEWRQFLKSGGKDCVITPPALTEQSLIPPRPPGLPLQLSTSTSVVYLNAPIPIDKLFWEIPIVDYDSPQRGLLKKQIRIVCRTPQELDTYLSRRDTLDAYSEKIVRQVNNPQGRSIKFKDERKLTVGYSKKDVLNARRKVKNAFYNCLALIFRFSHDISSSTDRRILEQFGEVHVKVFNTGKMEIPGIFDPNILVVAKQMVLEFIQPFIPTPLIYLDEKQTQGVLINSNFHLGYCVNRENVHRILRSDPYFLETSYDSCSYPGVKCKYYYATENTPESNNGRILPKDQTMKLGDLIKQKKYMEVNIMIFRTGSVLLVGNFNEIVLNHVYVFIRQILDNHYSEIWAGQCVENSGDSKKEKIYKRTINSI